MPALCHLNSVSSHGGYISTASEDSLVNDLGIGRDQDLHVCPIPGHGTTSVTASGLPLVNGRKTIIVGDSAKCGAIILGGSPNTNVD